MDFMRSRLQLMPRRNGLHGGTENEEFSSNHSVLRFSVFRSLRDSAARVLDSTWYASTHPRLDRGDPAARAGRRRIRVGAELAGRRAGLQAKLRLVSYRRARFTRPSPDALKARTPQAVIESLMTGAMRAAGLAPQRTGAPRGRGVRHRQKVGGDVIGADTAMHGRAKHRRGRELRSHRAWAGWSPTITNTRFQSRDMAGLSAADVPR